MRVVAVFACALMLIGLGASPSHAEKRVALVVGNDRYVNLPADQQLQKAVNDSRAVGAVLGSLGFEVIAGENLGRQALVDRLDEMTRRLSPGDVAFFFFAGHGITIGGGNYIFPADVPNVEAGQETRLAHAALGESDIVSDLQQRGVRVAVVVLDACRDNPFRRPGVRSVGAERGLARIEPARGIFTMYSAGLGQTALDRLGAGDMNPNSVFTRVLVPRLSKPGLDLVDLARDVREDVTRLANSIGHEQTPAYYDQTVGERIYLAGLPVTEPSKPAPVTPSTGSTPQVAVVKPPDIPPRPADPCGGLLLSSQRAIPLCAAEERSLKPKDVFKECDKCPEMVVVPAGRFTMGSPKNEPERNNNEDPQHQVTIGKAFAVGKFAVTFDEWDACVADGGCNGYRPSDNGWGRGRQPVIYVSWDDAKAYVAWLSRKTGKGYRLLSEAEREYATRAGTTTPFWWGSSITPRQANYDGTSVYNKGAKGEYRKKTGPVDSFEPNPWGLYQVHGNVWDWVEDCWNDSYQGAPTDGTAWTAGDCSLRVLRGGSWHDGPVSLRSAIRGRFGDRLNGIGFRVGRTLTP